MPSLRIKEAISAHGMSIAQVAQKMNVQPSALSQSITGNPSWRKLCEIAEAIGCDVAELFESGGDFITCPHCGRKFVVKVEK